MSVPSFAARRQAWSSPPVDDIGYIPAEQLLAMDDTEFADLMIRMWHNRYEGWRNERGRWVELFGMTENEGYTGKRILDFGCGTGMEGAQFANNGNRVWVADIVPDNLLVARRLFALYGLRPSGELTIGGKAPFLTPPEPLDVIHCVGVLHHIPEPDPVVKAMHGWLVEGGILNLMLYSDRAWMKATGSKPPRNMSTKDHPLFDAFWQHWDPIGGYADWYDQQRIADRFGEWFEIRKYQPLTRRGEYVGAVLVKKSS